MDADDEAVLNLIAECEWDLSNPPGSMSSSQREPEASVQSSHGRLLLPLEGWPVQHVLGGWHRWLQGAQAPFLED